MEPVIIRNVKIGEGRPKICAPIVGRDEASILEEARAICGLPVDVAEWRADGYRHISHIEKTIDTARRLRETLKSTVPLLFTVRTARDGGEREFCLEDYCALNRGLLASGSVDLVDVELSAGEQTVKELIRTAHDYGVKVLVSSHDFGKTPPREELVRTMIRMQELGADMAKVAVMPRSREDVLTLLSATLEMYEHHARIPLVTMSMSHTGLISRLTGQLLGSAMTFGAAARTSAPGQIGVEELNRVLGLFEME